MAPEILTDPLPLVNGTPTCKIHGPRYETQCLICTSEKESGTWMTWGKDADGYPIPVPEDEKLREIKERRAKVPTVWKGLWRHFCSIILPHINSNQPVDDYWRQYDEHLDFIRHAPSDIDYLLSCLEQRSREL